MLKCVILLISSILKTVAVTLTQLHAREEKNMGFKNIHYFIGFKTSLSYISMVMGEKLCLNVPFFADFLDLKTVAATLTQLHAREERTHGFLAFTLLYWFKYIIVLH